MYFPVSWSLNFAVFGKQDTTLAHVLKELLERSGYPKARTHMTLIPAVGASLAYKFKANQGFETLTSKEKKKKAGCLIFFPDRQ